MTKGDLITQLFRKSLFLLRFIQFGHILLKKGGFKNIIYYFYSFRHCVLRLYQVQTLSRLSASKAGTHAVPDHPLFGNFRFSADDERTSPFIILL